MFNDTFRKLLRRSADSHKFMYGHVLVNGGSNGMQGAAVLTAQAALRAGAGLVTLALDNAPEIIAPQLEPEIMTSAGWDTTALQAYIQERRVSVVAIGSGLKPSAAIMERLRWLLDQPDLTLVIDGGALTSLKGNSALLDTRRCQAVILTPHPGEFARLRIDSLSQDRSGQVQQVQAFADQHNVICLLKGSQTYVAAKDMPGYTNVTGNPGMATAGSGDVLTGIIAGLVAQGVDALTAAQCGVYFHGLCGDIACAQLTQPGMNAGDIIAAIAPAYKHLEAKF